MSTSYLIQVDGGCTVDDAAAALVLAVRSRGRARVTFNGVTVEAQKGLEIPTVQDVVREWEAERARRDLDEYPEVIRSARRMMRPAPARPELGAGMTFQQTLELLDRDSGHISRGAWGAVLATWVIGWGALAAGLIYYLYR